MNRPVFALIDCNNFFVSCERLFRPDLVGKPVVVLSSNDGCAVSRSREAKALGIPMGAPAFQYRALFQTHGVVAFSANFALYGDISERITKLCTSITPHTEVYSVDECFLDLSELHITDYSAWARQVRQRIWREIGIPVSIGIAPSKTLAKLANEQAKQRADLHGVLDLHSLTAAERLPYLAATDLQAIWGIGWRLAPQLRAEGIHTAASLAAMRPQRAQQLMGIHGRQLVAELNGQACHPLETADKIRQMVMKGRTFGQDTHELHVVEAAITSLTARAAACLRREGLRANRVVMSVSTNRHKPPYERLYFELSLPAPSADTGHIAAACVAAFAARHNPRTAYHRVNILLLDLQPHARVQLALLTDQSRIITSERRMAAVDQLNSRYGAGTVRPAAELLSTAWQPRHRLGSPAYTTDWRDLPIARIL